MSNALKIEETNELTSAKKDTAEDKDIKANQESNKSADILEFSITSQIKDVDLSQLGNKSQNDASVSNIVSMPNRRVGETTHTQILEMAKASSEVDVLEAQVKLIALFVSEARMLEEHMNKYIHALHKQSPQSKKYLLQMKKIMTPLMY